MVGTYKHHTQQTYLSKQDIFVDAASLLWKPKIVDIYYCLIIKFRLTVNKKLTTHTCSITNLHFLFEFQTRLHNCRSSKIPITVTASFTHLLKIVSFRVHKSYISFSEQALISKMQKYNFFQSRRRWYLKHERMY